MLYEIEQGITIDLTPEQIAELESKRKSKNSTIFDRVKSYEDACKELNQEVNLNASAIDKIKAIARALNEGEKIDFKNKKQYKYFPYFIYSSEWSFAAVAYLFTDSSCPIAYVVSEEKAEYLGTQFLDLYIEILDNY